MCVCALFYYYFFGSIYLDKIDELHMIVVGIDIIFDLTKTPLNNWSKPILWNQIMYNMNKCKVLSDLMFNVRYSFLLRFTFCYYLLLLCLLFSLSPINRWTFSLHFEWLVVAWNLCNTVLIFFFSKFFFSLILQALCEHLTQIPFLQRKKGIFNNFFYLYFFFSMNNHAHDWHTGQMMWIKCVYCWFVFFTCI